MSQGETKYTQSQKFKIFLGEGVSGHCLIWASGMLLPKLRHILNCLAFSKKILSKNKTYAGQITFENTMGNSFFDFFKYWPKRFKRICIEIWTFSFQICFRNQFWTLESGQTENTQICVFVYFQFDHGKGFLSHHFGFWKSKKLKFWLNTHMT